MKRCLVGVLSILLCFAQACTPPGAAVDRDGVLDGPGFRVQVPNGFSPVGKDVWTPPSFASFASGYMNEAQTQALVISTVAPSYFGTSTNVQSMYFRITGAMSTQTGDFLLLCIVQDKQFRFEDISAFAMLADGSLLCVELDTAGVTAGDELLSRSIFSSIDLKDTDGWAFQTQNGPAMGAAALRVKASDGTLILSDRSAWGMRYDASASDYGEVSQWAIGDRLIDQQYRQNPYDFEDTYDLVHVGRWVPVKVEYYGQTLELSIAQIVDSNTLKLSDGTLSDLLGEVPAGWKVGDTVFKLTDPGIFSTTVVHEGTGIAVNVY